MLPSPVQLAEAASRVQVTGVQLGQIDLREVRVEVLLARHLILHTGKERNRLSTELQEAQAAASPHGDSQMPPRCPQPLFHSRSSDTALAPTPLLSQLCQRLEQHRRAWCVPASTAQPLNCSESNSCPWCPKSDIQVMQVGSAQDTWHSSTASHLELTLSPAQGPDPLRTSQSTTRAPRPCSLQGDKNSMEMNGCLRAHSTMGAAGTELKIII